MKRLIDVLAGGLLALAVTPVVLVAAIATAITLRAWPFFTQTRIGLGGREFRCVKLRTLPSDFPPYTDKYAIAPDQLPRFSWFLRRFHIDELPQLASVVLGRMSLVGPRPEMPYLHEQMDDDFAALRTSVRPGCTGLWQISAKRVGMIHESPEFDVFYVRHHTIRLDLWILRRTFALPWTPMLPSLDELPEWARPAPLPASQHRLSTADA